MPPTPCDQGWFAEEIVPVTVRDPQGRDRRRPDEHPRPDTTAEQLAALRPVMGRTDPEATVTAGNASGQNDAAAACLVTTADTAERLGLTPLVRLVSFARTGVAAKTMGIGPVEATRAALERAGLSLADLDLIELNEAFAAQVLACTRELGLTETDHEQRINTCGSGISLGHPVGATGARILTTLTHHMQRTRGAVRAGDDVHRRRAGTGRRLRARHGLNRAVRSPPEAAPRSEAVTGTRTAAGKRPLGRRGDGSGRARKHQQGSGSR